MARILMIEDSAFQRFALKKLLKPDHHEILEADDGQKGLERARQEKPEVILTDILMPNMNGLEFLQALQEEGLGIPVIVVTADIQETTRQKAREFGVRAIIKKPPKGPELREAIQDALPA